MKSRHMILTILKIGLVPLVAVILYEGCQKAPPAPPPPSTSAQAVDPVYGHLLHAQPRLPTIKVWLGSNEVTAEIAQTDVAIHTGMMFRTNMPENEAMIFVFNYPSAQSFYMRNCFVPLSAAYISPEGEILQIIDMQPHNETGVPSRSSNVQFVLETPQGWFERHNVHEGMTVRTERGPLLKSFPSHQ
jgi:uncharacterized membrane protein (UPF0127 family)